jgi:hypothetical protein
MPHQWVEELHSVGVLLALDCEALGGATEDIHSSGGNRRGSGEGI